MPECTNISNIKPRKKRHLSNNEKEKQVVQTAVADTQRTTMS